MKKNLQLITKDVDHQKEEIKRLRDKELRLNDNIKTLEKDIQAHKKEIREREETITDKEKRIFDLKKKNQELDQKLKMVSKSRETVISVIKNVTRSFPEDVKVDVNKLEVRDSNLVLEGVHYEGDINRVTESLKKLALLSELTISQEGPRFTYKAKINGR